MKDFFFFKWSFLVGLIIISQESLAQAPSPSTNKNYIIEHNVKVNGLTSPGQLNSQTVSQVNRSIQYFDGLGRPEQGVIFSASPGGKDIVQHMVYDNFGREQYKYLPYVIGASIGAYRPSSASEQSSYYNTTSSLNYAVARDASPFSRTIFEPSPLNRVLKQGAPGAVWQPNETISANDKSVRFEYTTNAANEVYRWEVTSTDHCKLHSSHYYEANQLYLTVTKDENWKSADGNSGIVKEYKDKQGSVVLKRTYEGANAYDTYYVYDDFGNLRVVIPPEGINKLGSQLTQIDEGPNVIVVTSDLTLTGTSNKKYYYCPGVTVTLSPDFTGAPGFEVAPYPLDANLVDQYLFVYKYDERQRMIGKKVPGAQPVYMVYDERDRLVLTQDGEQRKTNTWLFTKYDALNRPVLTGTYINSGDRDAVQSSVNAYYVSNPTKFSESRSGASNTDDQGYTDQSFPNGLTNSNYLTATYYDDYDFIPEYHQDIELKYPTGQPSPYDTNVRLTAPKGRVTGGKVKILNSANWLTSAVYYDNKYRVIFSAAKNNRGGWEKVSSKHDFVGNIINERYLHIAAGHPTLTVNKIYTYDHVSRLKTIQYRIGDSGTPVTLLSNEYNEIGELITKKLHSEGSAYAQTMDYRYNIRGWLTEINDPANISLSGDYFGMKLRYNDPQGTTALQSEAQYNGNISEIQWQNAQTAGLSAYGFKYDKLNRLKTSRYAEGAAFTTKSGYWDENMSYDLNGNIQSLLRKAAGTTADNLTYGYTGNQLDAVTDAATYSGPENHFADGNTGGNDYEYDANGNMIRDKNKGIASITYNHLNLPRLITFDNGNTITYLYDATGVKLQKTVTESGQPNKLTFYVGGIVYEDNVRKFMSTEEGRIVLETSTPEYQYHMKDHLGNVRLTFTTASSAQQTSTYMATMEPEAMTLEAATFNNIETTQQEDKIFNHTPGGKASARLNAAEDRVMGPSMTLMVMPGDTVRMKVQAKYFKKARTKDPVAGMAGIVAASLSGGAVSEAPQIAQGIQETLGIGQAGLASKDNSIPKAYINYLFFDKENNFKKGGYKQVSEAALGSFEELALDFAPEEEGTIMIYTANQTAEDLNVYMDDMMVMHTEGPIIRVDDYYPFGLTYNTSERTGYLTNKYLYNGMELQTDLGWENYLADFRSYDPTIGRWGQIDPKTSERESPYVGMANNPNLYVDPRGDTIMVNNTGYITKNDETDNLVFTTNGDGELVALGEIGGEINVDGIYSNLLKKNMKESSGMLDPFDFKEKVTDGGDWDLKNDKTSIFGLGNDGKTTFNFEGESMESQDVGNHHFGVVALANPIFRTLGETFILKQAGQNQMSKPGMSKPEWQQYEEVTRYSFNKSGTINVHTEKVMLPPYGDDPRDQKFIIRGFEYFKKNR